MPNRFVTHAVVSVLAILVVPGWVFGQAPVAATPAATGRVQLPAIYQPQTEGARFNSNEPRLVLNTEDLYRMRYTAPQWLQQALAFPPPDELTAYLGREPAATRERAAAAISSVVNPANLPPDFPRHMIPMARWAVFYEDWKKHGGTDVFLVKFQASGFTILIIESHNHVIVAAREIDGDRTREFDGMLQLVYHYANKLLAEPLKPAGLEHLKLFRSSLVPPHIYGFYTPRIEVLTGDSTEPELTTAAGLPDETSKTSRATATRFFSNGEFVAFMILKPINTAELRNPFETRFDPLNLSKPEEVPFWEEKSLAGRPDLPDAEELRRRQIREYLGSFFYDQEGNALTDRIPVQDLEREFTELSREQKVDIARRKMVDESYAAGMKAFTDGKSTEALTAWTRILQFEPENARAAILLQLAIKQRAKANYAGNPELARRAEPAVQVALEAINRQQTLLSLRQQQEGLDLARERAIQDFRTRAINFFSEGSYQESLREWDKLLSVDPGNANALLFKEICETKIKQEAARRPAAPPARR